jgi:hypothetical protein
MHPFPICTVRQAQSETVVAALGVETAETHGTKKNRQHA